MVASGKLDRLVTIERKPNPPERSETGAVLETWATWRKEWMGKRSITGAERLRADQELAVETAIWDAHYIDGLRTDDRLNVQGEGKIYDIIGIAEVGRRAGHEITATAVRV